AQNTMAFTSSSVTPRLGPSRVKIHAPNRKPIAMPTPWGEMAKLPSMWMRSRTGQPMAPSSVTGASLASVLRQRVGHDLAEEQPADHVGRVVHADIGPGDPNRRRQTTERRPGERGKAELPSGDRDEREQDRGMAARPRGGPRWLDQ